MGEFQFFMAQPFAITLDDFFQWSWRRFVPGQTRNQYQSLAIFVGYMWTFIWFSVCLHWLAKGVLEAGIYEDAAGASKMIELGRNHAAALITV
jgi:hypothetical protein